MRANGVTLSPMDMVSFDTSMSFSFLFADYHHSNLTGMLRFADGSEYEGQFERGLYHGLGTIRYANKIEYQGQWSKGRRQGQCSPAVPFLMNWH